MLVSKKNHKVAEEISNSSNIIGKGTVLEGNLETLGNLRIEGKVIGNIKSKSKVALGISSFVNGNIVAKNAELAGEVKGILEISEILILKSSAVIHGDIHAEKLIVESGAVFNGRCKMGAVKKDIQIRNNDKTQLFRSRQEVTVS